MTPSFTPYVRKFQRLALMAGAAMVLPACQHLGLDKNKTPNQSEVGTAATLYGSKLGNNIARPDRTSARNYSSAPANNLPDGSIRLPSDVGRVPTLSVPSDFGMQDTGNNTAPRSSVRTIDAYVAPLPVPEFINVVYGEMLKVPFVPGKKVAAMTDIISLRSSGKMKTADFQALVEIALEEYGVRVVPESGTYKIVEDEVLRARIPAFVKSRARARTRADLRPVVQFVELQAISAISMDAILKQAFNRSENIKISANTQSNYMILAGLPEDVDAALAIILQMDELNYAGAEVKRYTPQYRNVDASILATTANASLNSGGMGNIGSAATGATRNISNRRRA